MRAVVDIETDKLINPTKIWCVVCKDIDTGEFHIFRNVHNVIEKKRFKDFASNVDLWIGHHFLGFDYPVLQSIVGLSIPAIADNCIDTYICSKLIDYSKIGHSIETYGHDFGLKKGDWTDFSKWSQQLEDYCVRDVDICHRIYIKYSGYINDPIRKKSIQLEHQFQAIANDLSSNGFGFNANRCRTLLNSVNQELDKLDADIQRQFPERDVIDRYFTPRATKFGTINRASIPRHLRDEIHNYDVGVEYPVYIRKTFNPASHKQVIEILWDAGWVPTVKTKTHVDLERKINRLKHTKNRTPEVDTRLSELYTRIQSLSRFGWKINEENLSTLPASAPSPARTLAKRILYESRRRTLTEWLGLFNSETGRIHGSFSGLGAWTHRMAHTKPNTANIPNELKTNQTKSLLGKEMRSLWCAPRNRLLVGVDAEGIQLRIFAHYIDDKEFTEALVKGKKDDKSDPHSLNARILGHVCKGRQAAKRFIYALLLGGGIGKLTEILECSRDEAEEALARLMGRYQGFEYLKRTVIPADARRGYFQGLDGRLVRIPGDTIGQRKHLCMSGYLQNGEAIVMKAATLKFYPLLKQYNSILVDLVHDEWQTETPNNMEVALKIASAQADALYSVGMELGLKCPLAGSYWNDDKKDYTIGTSWSVTH
jgi:DNA polymerase-1